MCQLLAQPQLPVLAHLWATLGLSAAKPVSKTQEDPKVICVLAGLRPELAAHGQSGLCFTV